MLSRSKTYQVPLLLCTLLPALPGAAQKAPPAKPVPGVFKQVIPQPTGKNGYEELVFAADLLQECKIFRQVEADPAATLTDKRRVVADRTVMRAMLLMRQGLSKPIGSPRASVDGTTIPPELTRLRSLSRLLRIQQYVHLADGKVNEAIHDARLGLRLGRAIQTDSLLTGLVGVAVSATSLQSLGGHLDQLSVKDCDLLQQVCLEWLNQPDTLGPIFEAERKLIKNNIAGLAKQIPMEAGAPPPPYLDEAVKFTDELFTRLFAELRKVPWQRTPVTIDGAPEFSRALLQPVLMELNRATERYTREMAQVRLLAVHTRIRSHRWHTSKLPASLSELQLGELAIDPFTGRPLEYEVIGNDYRLTSAGPLAPNDPTAVNGRKPVSVVPE